MTNATWLPFAYRSFYDVPRMILVRRGDHAYLFDCPFDDERDDYADSYKIYLLPKEADAANIKDWESLVDERYLAGYVPVKEVRFDTTKRKFIDDAVFSAIRT